MNHDFLMDLFKYDECKQVLDRICEEIETGNSNF